MSAGSLPRNRTCSKCGGVMTCEYARHQPWYACMRCDTDDKGNGWGPPRFMRIWDERRGQIGIRDERGSE